MGGLQQVYNAALASVAAGFTTGNPQLVLVADELLEQLQDAQEGLVDKQVRSVRVTCSSTSLGKQDQLRLRHMFVYKTNHCST